MEGEGFGERRGRKARVNVCQPRMGLNTAGSRRRMEYHGGPPRSDDGECGTSVSRIDGRACIAIISSTTPCLTWQMIHMTAAKCCGRNHLFNRSATSLHIAPREEVRGRGEWEALRKQCVVQEVFNQFGFCGEADERGR